MLNIRKLAEDFGKTSASLCCRVGIVSAVTAATQIALHTAGLPIPSCVTEGLVAGGAMLAESASKLIASSCAVAMKKARKTANDFGSAARSFTRGQLAPLASWSPQPMPPMLAIAIDRDGRCRLVQLRYGM